MRTPAQHYHHFTFYIQCKCVYIDSSLKNDFQEEEKRISSQCLSDVNVSLSLCFSVCLQFLVRRYLWLVRRGFYPISTNVFPSHPFCFFSFPSFIAFHSFTESVVHFNFTLFWLLSLSLCVCVVFPPLSFTKLSILCIHHFQRCFFSLCKNNTRIRSFCDIRLIFLY